MHAHCVYKTKTRRCGSVYLGVAVLGVCDVLLCVQLVVQSKPSLRQLSQATSSSYDHMCGNPIEL